MKNADPVMGAKLKSKTHLQNTFFDFLSRFLRIWLQSLQKVLLWPPKFFFLNQQRCQKRGISRWFRIRWKSFEKMHQKKVISKNVTEICTFFTFTYVRQTCFACNFFWCIFLQLFQRIRNQRETLRFWPFLIKKIIKKILGHISTSFKLWSQTRKKRLKKSKNVFSKCDVDFNFAPIKGSVFFNF